MTYVDYCCIAVVAIFCIIGIKRGFLKEIGRIICWLISLIGSKILVTPVELKLYDYFKVKDVLSENIMNVISKADFTSLDSLRDSLNAGLSKISFVGSYLGSFTDKEWAITDMYQKGIANMELELHNFILETVEPIAHQVVGIGAFILLFIAFIILSSLFYGLFEKLFTSIKLVGGVNGLLGGIVGIIKGILVVLILYSILFLAFTMTKSENLALLKDSYFYENFIGIEDYVK